MVDLAGIRALVREVNFAVHGAEAVVTVPDAEPVSTRIIWMTPTTELLPTGNEQRADPRRVLAIRRDDVPSVPRGTTISVTEHLQNEPTLWTVDGILRIESDHVRAIVVPAAVTA